MSSSRSVCAEGRKSAITSAIDLGEGARRLRPPAASRRPAGRARGSPPSRCRRSGRSRAARGSSSGLIGTLSLRAIAAKSALRPSASPGGKSGMCTSSRPCRLRSTSSRSGRDGGEDPDDLAAVARVRHLLGHHRVDAAREPGVAVAAAALAHRLVGLVDEDDHLPEGVQDGEDLLEVALGGAHPLLAEVLELDARARRSRRPGTPRGTSCRCRCGR